MPNPLQLVILQKEILIKIALFAFCAGLWFSFLYPFVIPILILAWLWDDGAAKFKQMLHDPFIQAILIMCAVLLLGLLWSDAPFEGRHKWRKYFLFLIYIPFLSLINKERLPWAVSALLMGFCFLLFVGLYQWIVENKQGIPVFNMSYLRLSSMLGLGCIIACYFAFISRVKAYQIILVILALTLLYLQFHQSARGFLLATVLTLVVMAISHFGITLRKLTAMALSLIVVTALFAYTSPLIQERWDQISQDFEKMEQGNYSSSIGYRIAIWDVGVHSIAQSPFLGNGTGRPESYFDEVVPHYKEGIYKDLPAFLKTSHYHNDWIEIGMHVGILGILSIVFLLWTWYQTFKRNHLTLFGIAMLSFILLSGLTEVFLLFGRMPVLMLVITAMIVCWQKHNPNHARWHLNRA